MSKHCVIMQRMKENYENRQRHYLTRRIPVIIRIDGKAFHTYTKDLQKPFDDGLIEDMNETAIYLCQNIQGAKCAYVQSDEISILVTDYDDVNTQAWFDYDQSKVESISASLATGKFNQLRLEREHREVESVGDNENLTRITLAHFDSRAFNIPKEEVANYFLARQKDAVKNSISSVAQSLYSHKELEGVNSNQKQELIFQKGINWNNFDSGKKRGRFIIKNTYVNDQLLNKFDFNNPIYEEDGKYYKIVYEQTGSVIVPFSMKIIKPVVRTKWEVVETPETFKFSDFEQWL